MEDMLKKIDKYDFFMYTEDDVLVPWEAVEMWHKDTLTVYPHGYVRGFIRAEKDSKGALVATDITEKIKAPVIKKIGGRRYLLPPQPYHAFWIYTKEEMREFIHHGSWAGGNHSEWGAREYAAAGMMWKSPGKCRALIPLSRNNNVPEEALAYHLPNNYALNEISPQGKIPVNRIISK